MTIETVGLWAAVDTLTRPTSMRIYREAIHDGHDLAADLLHDLANNPRRTRCSVAEYHRATELAAGQDRSHGTIPSLIEQAEAAVIGQGDSDEGGAVLGRERSVADLALMESLFTVREIVQAEIRDHYARPRPTLLDQIRQAASLVAAAADEDSIEWWTLRLDQWARIIANQINAVDNGPRPFRLRDSPCPECRARQVRVREQGEWRLVPPLRIDFRDGMVRAATCTACGHAWMRGDDLNQLGDTLGRSIVANTA